MSKTRTRNEIALALSGLLLTQNVGNVLADNSCYSSKRGSSKQIEVTGKRPYDIVWHIMKSLGIRDNILTFKDEVGLAGNYTVDNQSRFYNDNEKQNPHIRRCLDRIQKDNILFNGKQYVKGSDGYKGDQVRVGDVFYFDDKMIDHMVDWFGADRNKFNELTTKTQDGRYEFKVTQEWVDYVNENIERLTDQYDDLSFRVNSNEINITRIDNNYSGLENRVTSVEAQQDSLDNEVRRRLFPQGTYAVEVKDHNGCLKAVVIGSAITLSGVLVGYLISRDGKPDHPNKPRGHYDDSGGGVIR